MKFDKKKALFSLTLLLLSNVFVANAQNSRNQPDYNFNINMIRTAVPILLISPDSRSGGLGDVGAATTPDANSTHWNNAKFAFIEEDFGLSLSYSPWMRSLSSDINLAYLAAYKRINTRSALAFSLFYFDLGSIEFFNDQATSMGDFNPYEMAVDATYSMKLSDKLSGGVSGRFILSDLTSGQTVGGMATHAATGVAADIGLYWVDQIGKRKNSDEYALGLAITNLGSKISYSDENTDKDFLPTNLRIGGRYTMNMDMYNEISFMLDLNKLLVPTSPIYDDNREIVAGMDRNVGIMQGLIQSFYDAPGGFSEEMKEISTSLGIEYWYDKKFAVRAGYFYENVSKGDRQFITLGAGLRYNLFGLDISYLIPLTQNNSLQNTLRFTLMVDLKKN